MVAHPALLVSQKIPVDEDAILTYLPNLVEAVPGEFNATPFLMAHNISFHKIQAHAALHIWPHSIKISPGQLDYYDIPNFIFCNSKILSQKCPSEPYSEENEASLLVMENCLFDHLQDSMTMQSRAIYEMLHHVFEDNIFELASNSKGNTELLYNRCPENNTAEKPNPNYASDSKENTKTFFS
jgi:hypothetical protein